MPSIASVGLAPDPRTPGSPPAVSLAARDPPGGYRTDQKEHAWQRQAIDGRIEEEVRPEKMKGDDAACRQQPTEPFPLPGDDHAGADSSWTEDKMDHLSRRIEAAEIPADQLSDEHP